MTKMMLTYSGVCPDCDIEDNSNVWYECIIHPDGQIVQYSGGNLLHEH